MAVSINISEHNQVAIQQSATPSVSLVNIQSNSVSVKKGYVHSISINNVKPVSVILTNPQSGNQAISTWGAITGTITNQTDLVNYITSRLPDVPFETVSDIVNALNQLDEFRLQSSVSFRPENFGIGDESNEYTFPSPLTSSEKYGYFLFSDSNGVLNWKLFPLDFITGFDEGAKVDGGTF